jgi:hypothetical protein
VYLSRIGSSAQNSVTLVSSSSAMLRLDAVRAFLRAHDAGAPALIVAPSPGAATWLVSDVLEPERACFGWRRRTLDALAGEVALPVLARAEEVPVRRLGLEALCARVVHAMAAADALGRFSSLSRRPGFVRALASSLDELRLAGIGEAGLAPHDPDMAKILGAYVASLREAKLADRARVFEAAAERARSGALVEFGTALVMLDVPLVHATEAAFAIELGVRVAKACVTVPLGDACTREAWLRGCGDRVEERRLEPEGEGELSRLQRRLFAEPSERPEVGPVAAKPHAQQPTAAPSETAAVRAEPSAPRQPAASLQSSAQLTIDWDDSRSVAPATVAVDTSNGAIASVASNDNASEAQGGASRNAGPVASPATVRGSSSVGFASSPGESRECVEVARSILRAAEGGVAFDRMAVAVRAVENYRAVLEEALARARVPAHFADGVRRPAPEGRAFNALLTCAAEGLSARSFAEYLSIGVMPQAAAESSDAASPSSATEGGSGASEGAKPIHGGTAKDGADAPVGSAAPALPLVSPRRWERLILDASVVGGIDRWRRRLGGLLVGLRIRAAAARDELGRERALQEIAQLEALQLSNDSHS